MIYLKIDKRVKDLNDKEAYYMALQSYTQLQNKVYTRDYFAKCLKCSVDYIKKMNSHLYKAELLDCSTKVIIKDNGNVIKTNTYKSIINTFFMVKLDFVINNIDKDLNLLGFALRIRSLAFDDTLKIKLNKKDIAKELDITYNLLNNKLNKLKEYGFYLDKVEDGYQIRYEEFIKNEVVHLNEQNIRTIKNVLSTPSDNKLYKQTVYFVKNKLYLSPKANNIYNDILAGLFGLDRKQDIEYDNKDIFEF